MLSIRPVSRSENGTIHRPKTPGRGLQNENAIRLPPATVLNKGKNVMQTPFQPKSLKPQRLFKEESQAKGSERLAPKPFLDKTPFPNRIALQTNAQTPFGPNLSVDTPDSLLRPSSTRKHIRVPRTSLKYETPMNTKNHWDLSDDDMSVPVIEEVPKLLLPEDDYDEVEYMAPNTLDLPYQPPFDFELPNYKDVGKRLLEMAWSGCVDDEFQPPELEPDIKDLDLGSWEGLTLPPLEDDDPFREVRQPKPTTKVASKSTTTSKIVATKKIPSTFTSTIPKSKPVPPRPLHSRTQSLFAAAGAAASTVSRSTSRISTSRPGTSAALTGPSQTKPIRSQSVTSNRTTRTNTRAPVAAARARSGTTTSRRVENSLTTGTTHGPVRQQVKPSSGTKAGEVPKRPATAASTYRPAQSNLVDRRRTASRTGAGAQPLEEDVDLVKFSIDTGDDQDDFLFDV